MALKPSDFCNIRVEPPGHCFSGYSPGRSRRFKPAQDGRLPEPWRDIEPSDENPNDWPRQNEDQLIRYFGEVGKNQAQVQLPFTHRLAWDKKVRIQRFSCHAKVHDSIQRVLTRVLNHYGVERIRE